MISPKFTKMCLVGLTLSLSGVCSAGLFDGPLTQQQSAKPAATSNSGAAASSNAASSQGATTMQFNPQAGGAPTANADSNAVTAHLPPVVSAQPGPGVGSPVPATTSIPDQSRLALSAPQHTGAGGQDGVVSAPTVGLPAAQAAVATRLQRVEQQLKNLVQMNLPQQISNMQMQIQQLSGQLQVQEHDLKLLNTQQRNFYQDLDQRITKLSATDGKSAITTPKSTGSSSSTKSSTVSNQEAMSNLELQDSNAYKKALDMVIKGKYNDAITALQQYLNNFPNGIYKDKAHFWSGEIYFLMKKFKLALSEFNLVVSDSPKSPRVPDAKLKIALIHLQQGKRSLAQSEFAAIKKAYPNSTAAQLAIIQLKQLAL